MRKCPVLAVLISMLLAGCDLESANSDASHAAPARTQQAAIVETSTKSIEKRPSVERTGSRGACPEEMAYIAPFCVDRYEAYLVEVDAQGERPYQPDQRPLPGARYRAKSSRNVLPQGYISRPEAEQACRLSGKRLCSLDEWYRACVGPKGWVYPYGSKFVKDRCNVAKPHLLSRFFGSEPRAWKYDEHFNNPMLNRQPGFLALTGEYGECVSAEGVYDLVGNLHEWVSDKVDRSLPLKVPLSPALRRSLTRTRGHGIFMGGFFSTTNEHGRGCRFVTIGHEPTYHDYSTGFRCCKDQAG